MPIFLLLLIMCTAHGHIIMCYNLQMADFFCFKIMCLHKSLYNVCIIKLFKSNVYNKGNNVLVK